MFYFSPNMRAKIHLAFSICAKNPEFTFSGVRTSIQISSPASIKAHAAIFLPIT